MHYTIEAFLDMVRATYGDKVTLLEEAYKKIAP